MKSESVVSESPSAGVTKVVEEKLEDAGPTKKDRKKLKKLRKRAFHINSDAERSGLLTRGEWVEYKHLLGKGDTSSLDTSEFCGTLISRRKKKEGNKVEGSHHRDLLAWLLRHILHLESAAPSKKRPRSESTSKDPLKSLSIPSWVSVHNPGAVESLNVVELQVPHKKMQLYLEAISSINAASNQKHLLQIPTKLFQGYTPRSISDCLFYFTPDQPKPKHPNSGEIDGPSHTSLLADLGDLILSEDDWAREYYPIVDKIQNKSNEAKLDSRLAVEKLEDPATLALGSAKEWIAEAGFRIQTQEESDQHSYIRTAIRGSGVSEKTPVRIFGMDCEMVITEVGMELARITLVQLESFTNNSLSTTTVMDALVKPYNPVKDYVTRHSGITAKLLDPVSTRLEQVQLALARFLHPNDILVGHSLENDLKAVHYIHPRVIDTAIIFRHHNRRTKFSLRHLSNMLLRKSIQQGSHCSEEDALATLELAVRRAWLGDSFCIPGMDQGKRSVLELLKEKIPHPRSMCVGPSSWLTKHVTNDSNGVHALAYDTIADCQKAMLAWIRGPRKTQLQWCHLSLSENSTAETVTSMQKMLTEILESTPATGITVIVVQEGLDNAIEVFRQRRARQDQRSSLSWTEDQEKQWKLVLESCRAGVAFWSTANPQHQETK